ncbi:MAG: Cof-type HAD-IIB family hydrolase [Lachnospiraceae bacterium]|jgi:Cof subfamily protein (haloacid dehalogenase superfamily)|nr:Cof-type HAD-IIB family hydrolase [Lachnospiraceae bacterium]
MIKAIFFDIDGTLRDFTEKGIRPGTYQAIDLARSHGIQCFIATGRHLLEIQEENLLDRLIFDGYVLLNGSLCLDGRLSPIYENPIPTSQVQAMLALQKKLGFSLLFMEKNALYVSHITPQLEKLQAQIGTAIPPVEPYMERGLTHPVYQMSPFSNQLTPEFLASHLPLCDITSWHDGGAFDITPKGGDKQKGIKKIMKHYGFSRKEVAAIGDGYNDIPMIRYAAIGIAMGNGNRQVKEAADFVTDPIEKDGLLHGVEYLSRFF